MKQYCQRYASFTSNNLRIPLFGALVIEIISGLQIIHMLIKTIFTYNDNITESDFATFLRKATSIVGGFDFISSFMQNGTQQFLWIIFTVYLLMHLLLCVFLMTFT